MRFLKSLKLSAKVPAILIGMALSTAVITAWLGYESARNGLVAEAQSKLAAIRDDRVGKLADWFSGIEGDITTQAENPAVAEAVQAFAAAYVAVDANPTAYLQDWYIGKNPNPAGQKEKLDSAPDGSVYSGVHAAYHPFFRKLLQDRGYYDIFLFDPAGNVVYSVYKELDFATNVVNGQWSGTDLAAVFTGAKAGAQAGAVAFKDFAPYAPSNNVPAGFVATPIRSASGEMLGVIAFQMPVDRLNTVLGSRTGLGETGHSYAVGEDNLMRSSTPLSEVPTLLTQKVDTASVDVAFGEGTGALRSVDYNGREVFSAVGKVDALGNTWAVVVEQSAEEVLAPVTALRNRIFVQLGVFTLIVGGIGLFVGRSITRPLQRLGQAMEAISGGALNTDVADRHRGDEIGTMANGLEVFRAKQQAAEAINAEAVFKGSAFAGSSVAMMMVDRDLKIVFANDAMQALFAKNAETFKKAWPSFNPEKMIGACIDVFDKNPAQQRQMLADPSRLPFRSDISVGNLKISLSVSAVFDRDGQLVGNTLEWADVTADRLNAGILAAIDRKQAIIEFSLDGVVQDANENFLAVTGYTKDEIVGKHHRIFCDEALRSGAEYRQMWEQLRRGETYGGRLKRVGKDNRTLWLDGAYNPVLDLNGNPYKVIKIASDITEVEVERLQQRTERERREEEQNCVVSNLQTALQRLSAGDLTAEINRPFAPAYEQLRADYNSAVGQLRDLMNAIILKMNVMRNGVGEISQAADDLSRRTESQAASLEETAAALDEATTSVRETAGAATTANDLARQTRLEAENSGETVRKAVSAMTEIERSSGSISQIISVIDEIAFQTNLLALNAGVEAARAGDAGRGFAVVASEVRALAQRSSDAAKEIKQLISASTQHVDSGVDLVGRAGAALEHIVKSVTEVSQLVSTIASSAQEQSRGLAEINSAVNQMDQVTQQNAAMVEESTAASHSLNQEASELLRLVGHFNTGNSVPASAPARRAAPVAEQQRRAANFATNRGNAAVKLNVETDEAGWDEF